MAAALISRIFSRLVGFILVIALARHADTASVAVYGYLLGTSSLVIGLTSLGVSNISARDVAAGRIPVGEALRSALGPHLASLAVAAVLTVVVTLTLGPDAVPTSALALTVGTVLAGGLNGLYADLLRATGRVVLEGVLQMAATVALVAAGTFVVLHPTPVDTATALLTVILVKELALLLIGMALLRPTRTDTSTRDLLRQSIWLAVAGTAFVGLWRQGMLVVGATGQIGVLATYVVASRYQDAGAGLAYTAGFGLRPGFARLAGDPEAFGHTLRRYLGLATALGAATALLGTVAGTALVSVPFGPRWADAVAPVQVITFAAVPILVMFVASTALIARGSLRLVALGATAGTVTAATVSLILTHHQPTALSPTIGTAAGAAVIAVIYLAGLRDVLWPGRRDDPAVDGPVEPDAGTPPGDPDDAVAQVSAPSPLPPLSPLTLTPLSPLTLTPLPPPSRSPLPRRM